MFIICYNSDLQDTLAETESQLSELKNRLEQQGTETRKADVKFKFSLDEHEKLKTGLSIERTTWENEKVGLIQRAEAAESALKNTTAELTGLKRHIS